MRLSHKTKVKSKKLGFGMVIFYKLSFTENRNEFDASHIKTITKPKGMKRIQKMSF